ncbi:TIR domain-containing protein [Nodosilinea sp. PGN35]|uniref:TIR domain-containing protein n=1 Tax=Nodosilinea sp. PGN35 TaxID=3020489 RepID=UPI00398AF98B
MNPAPTGSRPSHFVSTFLSHASVDGALVEAVAQRLGRRGVLAWLDKNELKELGPLDTALKQAVQQQATLTIFLSEASANSSWCKNELEWALQAQDGYDHILPVYLGKPGELVKNHDLLRNRFLDYEGKVNQRGYICEQPPTTADHDAIAEQIAATAYQRSIPQDSSEILIVLDQRGNGLRRGLPPIPDNLARLNAPTLTFRPNLGLRKPVELITGPDWKDMAQTMTTALSYALGVARNNFRRVMVLSNAQTSLAWALGQHFDRTNNIDLYCYDRFGNVVTNQGQERVNLLPGGNPNSAQPVNDMAQHLTETQPQIALGVGSTGETKELYIRDAQQAVPNLPLFWIGSETIETPEQAMQLIADVVASIMRFRRDYGAQELTLFWTGPSHVAILAAANLTWHVIPKINYMEMDRAQGEYVYMPMP